MMAAASPGQRGPVIYCLYYAWYLESVFGEWRGGGAGVPVDIVLR